jgi:hypothetical protein
MSKLTVGDVQKSFTDYVALVKKTCKTEKEIQDLKNIMTTNDNKMIATMAKHQEYIDKNEQLINENKKLNKQIDAIEKSRFSKANTTPKKKEKDIELTNRPPWNPSTKITSNPGGGRTHRRKKYRRRTHKRTKK